MARSIVSQQGNQQTYKWPVAQFYTWILLLLLTASVILGIFAHFINIQTRMRLGQPWVFPFGVTVGCITIVLVILLLFLSFQARLTPEILMLVSFVLVAFYITGTIGTGIQVFGPGRVSSTCRASVDRNPIYGPNAYTLAWLQQDNICSCWYAVFAFWILGDLIYIWLFFFAVQVGRGVYD